MLIKIINYFTVKCLKFWTKNIRTYYLLFMIPMPWVWLLYNYLYNSFLTLVIMFWAHGYVNVLVNQTMVSKKFLYDPNPTSKIKTFSSIVKRASYRDTNERRWRWDDNNVHVIKFPIHFPEPKKQHVRKPFFTTASQCVPSH